MKLARCAMLLLLSGCSVVPVPVPVPIPGGGAGAPTAPEAYKRDVASRIAQANQGAIADALPDMLKSVVVLNVAVDPGGHLTEVSVRRSNGYRELEDVALESVRRAAPFPPPGRAVAFLETFLFRDDGSFQLRTLTN